MTGHRPFSELIAKRPPESRERVAKKIEALDAELPLNQLRQARALSQAQLAEVLEVDQPSISKLERRADMMISSLARFIEAMGGRLEIKAIFPSGEVRITGLAALAAAAKPVKRRGARGRR